MKLELEKNGTRTLISEPLYVDEMIYDILEYMSEHRYHAPYIRVEQLDNCWKIHVGSWFEFFYVTDYTDDDLDELPEVLAEANADLSV